MKKLLIALPLAFWACGDSTPSDPVVQVQYERNDLVSDVPGRAAHTDPNLINPWGIALGPDTTFWVANEGTGTLSLYNGNGEQESRVLHVANGGQAAHPIGLVYNDTDAFVVNRPVPGFPLLNFHAPAKFLVATSDGKISGWNEKVSPAETNPAVSADQSEFTGLAIASDGEKGMLIYAANFAQQRIDVYDASFDRVDLGAKAFDDNGNPEMPNTFSPFNVTAIDDEIYVAYAERNWTTGDEIEGMSSGYVSVFSTSGQFLRRFVSKGALNAPWGMVKAPSTFGRLSNTILIGNFGDGRINAFDPSTGALIDAVRDTRDEAIEIDGLWGLAFGNGNGAGQESELYFTAGTDGETHGLFGRVRPVNPVATMQIP